LQTNQRIVADAKQQWPLRSTKCACSGEDWLRFDHDSSTKCVSRLVAIIRSQQKARPLIDRASFALTVLQSRECKVAYAASSSTTPSSWGLGGPRRGPLASAASISLMASVPVTRCTAAISRESRSSAASYSCRSEYDCSGWLSDR